MKVNPQITLLIITSLIASCKPKTAENLEEMARRSSRPEAVLVKTVKLEPSTFYHELVSNGKAYSSEKAVIPFKVNGIIKPPIRFTPYYVGIASIGVIMALSAFVFPERKASLEKLVADEKFVLSYPIETMTSDEFALCLLKIMECNKFQIFDFRSEEEFKKMNFPKSTLFTVDNLFEKEPNILLNLKHKVNVFLADDELTARKMAIIATELGYKRIQILQGGLNAFRNQILNYTESKNPKTLDEEYTNRFRTKAKELIPIILANNKSAGPVKKVQKRVVGGC